MKLQCQRSEDQQEKDFFWSVFVTLSTLLSVLPESMYEKLVHTLTPLCIENLLNKDMFYSEAAQDCLAAYLQSDSNLPI